MATPSKEAASAKTFCFPCLKGLTLKARDFLLSVDLLFCGTPSKGATLAKVFCLPGKKGLTLQAKNSLFKAQSLFLDSGPLLLLDRVCRKASRAFWKSYSFQKWLKWQGVFNL